MQYRQFVGSLDGLAFLPLADVRQGMSYLTLNTPQGSGNYFLSNACKYFDMTEYDHESTNLIYKVWNTI